MPVQLLQAMYLVLIAVTPLSPLDLRCKPWDINNHWSFSLLLINNPITWSKAFL